MLSLAGADDGVERADKASFLLIGQRVVASTNAGGEWDLARNTQLAARMRDPIGLEFSGRCRKP